jgi:hypothetical protein
VEEAALALGRELNEKFGDDVIVKYVDTRPSGLGEFPLIAKLVQMGYPFPIVCINGKPRLAGAVDVEQIRELVTQGI